MINERINLLQFFVLLQLFLFGTNLVVGSGLDANKDAWMAILLGTVGGVLLFLIYFYLYTLYPSLSLVGYSKKILGKHIGGFLSLLYIPFFIYAAARDLRDIGGLMSASVYDNTPIVFINVLMILSVAAILYMGIEVFVRTAEVFWIVVIGLAMIGSLLIFISGLVNINNLLPLLEFGWKPVINATYTHTIMFPYGEMVAFTIILPHLKDTRNVLKTGIFGILAGGIFLAYSMALNISVLGLDVTNRSQFPLLSAIQGIQIMNLIEHLDVMALLTLIIGVFFKIAVFYYAAIVVMADLFKVDDKKKLVMPTAIVILYISIIIAENFSHHLDEGKFSLKTIFPLFAVGIPAFYCFIAFIKEKINKKKQGSTSKNTIA
ncbi:GerAB/ArcD/ProY family transporter [Alteribacillus sp. HJP-4]|uniref:GerAB/ArcD/ProY family transporter n=1 Tax=Alteribacillus sp. HJP-4 TaxID=2775394 RepID=UPI0035CD114B